MNIDGKYVNLRTTDQIEKVPKVEKLEAMKHNVLCIFLSFIITVQLFPFQFSSFKSKNFLHLQYCRLRNDKVLVYF